MKEVVYGSRTKQIEDFPQNCQKNNSEHYIKKGNLTIRTNLRESGGLF